MHRFIKLGIVLAVMAVAYLGSVVHYQWTDVRAYHGPQERNFFRGNNIELPLSDNGYFKGSGNCDGCHGFDETLEANVDEAGNDISPITTWRGSMMANAAKDPFWRAKVSHEVTVNPAHQEALEDKCTSCHAPMGRYSNEEFNLGPYGISDLINDSLGMDGVSCLACHKQSADQLGNTHSGVLNFASAPVAFGPFEKPFEPPMQDLVGVLPVYSDHINDAGICAGCHTLLTNSVDLDGNFTGETFVEQATYHEWLNSDYAEGANAQTCQGCHMPYVQEEVLISSNYSEIFPRSPYAKHDLIGGNSFMLKILKQNALTLGIAATDAQMDSAIVRTERMLQQQTLDLDLSFVTFQNDTGFFEVRLENLAGHKFPSGYPARRAFIEFLVIQANGDTLFQSGVLQSDHEILGQNATYEPHYNIIRQEDEAQIYELVMGDVNNDVTTILERAYAPIKDNRLAPLGFTTAHTVYDTTSIVGLANADTDFNFEGFEGSGTDVIHYHVPLNGYNGTIRITARIYYQSAPAKWMQEMFAVSTPTIDAFEAMYENADHTPVLIASDSILNVDVVTGIHEPPFDDLEVYPNPVTDGNLYLRGSTADRINRLDIYNTQGKLISTHGRYPKNGIMLPNAAGVYLIRLENETGDVKLLKALRP